MRNIYILADSSNIICCILIYNIIDANIKELKIIINKKQKNLCTVFFRVKKVICHLLRDIITFCAIIFASVLNACICEL